MHTDKLLILADHYLFTEKNSVTDDVLKSILEILLVRNAAESGYLQPYIDRLIDANNNQAEQ